MFIRHDGNREDDRVFIPIVLTIANNLAQLLAIGWEIGVGRWEMGDGGMGGLV
ncbi:hypothetical protein [Chamaesiphon sp. OTE_8_metabat_110]|uniref:hypothetical protein n=1 Tax=Chamaesiphon sp. OTE_8_metabat_110 TaxID=2964696 RepID=UPI00286C7B74|nr:hypothetical protein [Chamaesiphon sp. OTE_8_metabat_110]